MRLLTVEDLPIFEEEEKLNLTVRKARDTWLNEVKRVHNSEIRLEDTKALFDRYIKARNVWKNFSDKHSNILLAKATN